MKRLAIQAHDHENEQLFWAGELKSSRSLRRWNPKAEEKDDKDRPKGRHGWRLSRLLSPAWWFNILYGGFSDFGRSVVRPFLAWTVTVAFMVWVHLSMHFARAGEAYGEPLSAWVWQRALDCWGHWTGAAPAAFPLKGLDNITCEPLFAAFHLAVKKGLLVLGWDASEKFAQDYACLYGVNETFRAAQKGGELVPVIPDTIILWQMAQTVASAVLIFLFLLALRNHFKLK